MGEGYNEFWLDNYQNSITKAYQRKIKSYSDVPALGGEIGAAKKRYRAQILLGILQNIKEKDGVDMTPTLAKNLLKKCLGKSISETILLFNFGKKGRDASEKSENFEDFDNLVEKYKIRLQKAEKEALKCCDKVRDKVKKKLGK